MLVRKSLGFAALLLAACSSFESGEKVAWSALIIERVELELIDDQKYELYRFGKEGTVSATVGLRNGPLVAPLFYWRVEGDHLIISENPQTKTFADLYEPRKDGDVLFVKRGLGGKSKFRVTKRDA